MSAKTLSMPSVASILGFSTPVVRSENRASKVVTGHHVGLARRTAVAIPAKTSRTASSNAITSRVRTAPMRRATSVRTMSFGQNVRAYIGLSLAVGTVALSLVYVVGINNYAATGYEIKKEQVKLSDLQEENKKLMVKTAESGSIAQIQEEASSQNLVSITAQEYLQPNHLSQR